MASTGNGNGSRNQPPALTEETVRELIAVQKQEISLRLEEVRRDSAEITHNQSIAKQSIEAQERDRKHDREEVTKRQKGQQWFTLAAIVVLVSFTGYALAIGQSALVLDILKLLIGVVGGMGYQAYKTHKTRQDD